MNNKHILNNKNSINYLIIINTQLLILQCSSIIKLVLYFFIKNIIISISSSNIIIVTKLSFFILEYKSII